MMKRDIKIFIYSVLMGLSFSGMIIFGGAGSIKFTLLSIFVLFVSQHRYDYYKNMFKYTPNRLYQGKAIL